MPNTEATLLIKIKQTGERVLDAIGEGLEKIADKAKYVGAAVVGFIGASINEYRQAEQAVNQLNQTLVTQGIYTAELSKKYTDLATELQQTTLYGDEATLSAITQLQAYLGTTEVTKGLTKATQDFATAMGMDLKNAADLIGKTMTSSTNALSRYGIEVDVSASKQEKMEQIMNALNMRFAGQSEAAAKGLNGIIQLKNSFGDFMELIGQRFAPYVVIAVSKLKSLVEALSNSADFFHFVDAAIYTTIGSISSLIMGFKIAGGVIGTVLATAVESMSAVMSGQFSQAKEIAQLGMQQVSEVIAEEQLAHDERMNELDAEKAALEEQKRATELEMLRQAEQNKTAVIAAEKKKQDDISKKQADEEFKRLQQRLAVENAWGKARADILSATANLVTEIGGRESKAAFLAQKAAALAQAFVAMNLASAQALAVPPAPNFGLAGLARAAGMINIAAIGASTIKGLEDGGIVRARPGGMIAQIGEGGRDEAVIPLDSVGGGGIGSTINIVVNGGLLGDPQSAQEFALAVDKALLDLRRNNSSLAFDSGVI